MFFKLKWTILQWCRIRNTFFVQLTDTCMQCAKSVSALTILHDHLAKDSEEFKRIKKNLKEKGEVKHQDEEKGCKPSS